MGYAINNFFYFIFFYFANLSIDFRTNVDRICTDNKRKQQRKQNEHSQTNRQHRRFCYRGRSNTFHNLRNYSGIAQGGLVILPMILVY